MLLLRQAADALRLRLAQALTGARARLIDDLRHCWRFTSVWLSASGASLMAALAAFPGLWAAMPAEVRELLPARAQAVVPALFFVAILAARVTKQKAPAQ